MKTIVSEIIRIASKEVGVEEVNGTNCGVRVNQYKAATWLPADESWAWCAAFVCWVLREAFASIGARETNGFRLPRTAGAWDFENWSRKQDMTTWTLKPHGKDIQAGDIVIFRISHIGFAISDPDESGYVDTVEGNTDSAGSREGGGVFRKRRHISKIRSRIRFRPQMIKTQ